MNTQVKYSNVNLEVLFRLMLDRVELHNDDHYFVHNKVYHPTLNYENVSFDQLQVKICLKENINFSVSKLITKVITCNHCCIAV